MLAACTRVAVLLVVLTQALLLCHLGRHDACAGGSCADTGCVDPSPVLAAASHAGAAVGCTAHALPDAKPAWPPVTALWRPLVVLPPLSGVCVRGPSDGLDPGPLPPAVRHALPLLS